MEIHIAKSEQEIKECYAPFLELRPHLTENEFITQVQRQINQHNYTIIYIKVNNSVVSAAGYRVSEYLAWGKTLYVDDLITVKTSRNLGYGGKLMAYLIEKAKTLSCKEFHLDSGTHRHDAHLLYKKAKLNISSFHFSNEISKLNA